jgi:hypothetical protein
MTRRTFLAAASGIPASARAAAQAVDSYRVYSEPPRLLLAARHLRLLRRERERQSVRWQTLEALIAGKAALPEPGFAQALYYQTVEDKAAAARAVAWASRETADLRQLALVYDWCRAAVDDNESAAMARKLVAALGRPPATRSVSETSARVLAAIAIADTAPQVSEGELRRALGSWWQGEVVPAVGAGRDALPRPEFYALTELLHAVRDNLGVDLRQSLPEFFRQLPLVELLSYYPVPNEEAGGAYHVPASARMRPDFRQAMLSRAADLILVAYDPNALENQFLQGWSIDDRFLMRSAFGAPYEFLWANPYQPGLSYYDAPRFVHDRVIGRLFARSGWSDDAFWLGFFGGQLQTFTGQKPQTVALAAAKPIELGETAIHPASERIRIGSAARRVFVLGFEPARRYRLEAERQKPRELTADPGGILEITFETAYSGALRLKLLES